MIDRSFLAMMALCGLLSTSVAGVQEGKKTEVSPSQDGMVLIQGGTFIMGTDDGFPYEGPAHTVKVNTFRLDVHEVTVEEFSKFVSDTKYLTESEQLRWSGVFNTKLGEWEKVDGANWRHPEGPQSTANPKEPVTHVSWNDAMVYAKWAKKRLPTEAEWEYAAASGKSQQHYPWGKGAPLKAPYMANLWQGLFPNEHRAGDGFPGRAPVKSFPPNSAGLYDMAGNVWEWCSDWFTEEGYSSEKKKVVRTERVMRGGSWMCSENYCQGYRVAARSHATPDSALNNLGFRCARDE
jgi:formylglycine-generating enzyme